MFSPLLVPGKDSYAFGQQPIDAPPPTSGKPPTPVHCACAKISVKGKVQGFYICELTIAMADKLVTSFRFTEENKKKGLLILSGFRVLYKVREGIWFGGT